MARDVARAYLRAWARLLHAEASRRTAHEARGTHRASLDLLYVEMIARARNAGAGGRPRRTRIGMEASREPRVELSTILLLQAEAGEPADSWRDSVAGAVRGGTNVVRWTDTPDQLQRVADWAAGRPTLSVVAPAGRSATVQLLDPLLTNRATDVLAFVPTGVFSGWVEDESADPQGAGQGGRLPERCGAAMHPETVGRVVQGLQRRWRGRVIKAELLRCGDAGGGMVVVLATSDPRRALSLNQVLRGARFRDHFTGWNDVQQRLAASVSSAPSPITLDLWSEPAVEEAAHPSMRLLDHVAERLGSRCGAGELDLYGVHAAMSADPFCATEIAGALRRMKRQGRVAYSRPPRDASDRVLIRW